MNTPEQITAGSPVWQTVFFCFALLMIGLEAVRGWRSGLLRQAVRLGAVIAAYAAAFFGGRLLVPGLRTVFRVPDFILSAVGGAVLALLIYLVLSGLGRFLFKRTDQQQPGRKRLIYGLTGAALGLVFGGLVIWIMVVGVRSLGSIAEVQVENQATRGGFSGGEHSAAEPYSPPAPNVEPSSMLISMARLKNSIELGGVGEAVKSVDVVPSSTYDALGKLGQVVSSPGAAARFLQYPGAQEVAEHPKILALRSDPQIMQMISQGRFMDLLHDQRLIDAANDSSLVEEIKRFQVGRALEYATESQPRPTPTAPPAVFP